MTDSELNDKLVDLLAPLSAAASRVEARYPTD